MCLYSFWHLTHWAKTAQSGKWFNALHYEVDKETGLIDYDREDAPKLLPLNATSRIEIMTFANEIPLKINSLPFEIENTISVPMEIMILDVEGDHFISRSLNVILSLDIVILSI